MQVYFTTVNRGATVERGGELIRLDWRSKRIEGATCIFPSYPEVVDPNPRGNSRGGRGIALVGDELIVASYHTLKVFGPNLEHRRDLTHHLFVGLHEIHDGGNGTLWISSTAVDAALEVQLATGRITRIIWPREVPALQRRWGLTPLAIDKNADNRTRFLGREHASHPSHLHLNALATWRGNTFALFNSFGAIVNLDTAEVLVEDRRMRSADNLRIEADGTAFVNDTLNRLVRVFDLNTGCPKTTIALTQFEPIQRLARKYWLSDLLTRWLKRVGLRSPVARPLFVRGMHRVGDHLFVGMSPAAIACIDLGSGELVDFFQYSQQVGSCVHGIQVVNSSS